MITQDVYSLSREIQTLNEYHIKVARRSYSFFGEFRYMYMVGNEILKRKTLKPDKRVFSQYRSSISGVNSHDARNLVSIRDRIRWRSLSYGVKAALVIPGEDYNSPAYAPVSDEEIGLYLLYNGSATYVS